MHCPVCQTKIPKYNVPGKGFYHRCSQHGAYVSELFLKQLSNQGEIFRDLKLSPLKEPSQVLPCAYCLKPMPQKTILGVMPVEHCAKCRLVWFDYGEIEAVQDVSVRQARPAPTQSSGWELPSKSTRVQAETAILPFWGPQTQSHLFSSSGLENKANPGLVAIPLILIQTLIFFSLAKKGLHFDSIWLFHADWPPWQNGIRFLSSGFAHGSFAHLFGNMYFLWIFMDDVEEDRGPAFALGLFLFGVVGGNLASMFAGLQAPSLGASAGVFAVMTFFVMQFPERRFNLLLGHRRWLSRTLYVVPLPAWLYFGGKILLEVFLAQNQGAGGGTNHIAHVGGAAIGVIAYFWIGQGASSSRKKLTS